MSAFTNLRVGLTVWEAQKRDYPILGRLLLGITNVVTMAIDATWARQIVSVYDWLASLINSTSGEVAFVVETAPMNRDATGWRVECFGYPKNFIFRPLTG